MSESSVDRRDFLKSAAAGASAVVLAASSYNRVYGANERLGVGFVGVGGRCQAHLDIINKMSKEGKTVAPVAVCDVWDGYEGKYTIVRNGKEEERTYLQGLYPSAKKVGLNVDDKKHVTKDYRRLLELKEVDIVCVATPDHWHAKICIDAADHGKDVYCEKPMTKTIAEAHAVVDAMVKNNRVMSVGVQSMADPTWLMAHDLITSGKIGHVAQGQTSYYRNSLVGQWRYYHLYKEMNPKTIDWQMFLGHKFEVSKGVPLGPEIPFDRAVFGQWRCYWPFGGGMFTDLFVHQTTHMISAMGVRYPGRVVGGGGLYLEYDERDVPDVATIVADYEEGCQLSVTATMISAYPVEEVIRGRLGTIKFVAGGFQVIKDNPAGGASIPARLEESMKPSETIECPFPEGFARGEKDGWGNNNDTALLWTNFLECVRSKKRETLSTPELGAAAFTTVALGVQSYRTGKVLFWDKEQRKAVEADGSWSKRWEERSLKHGKPNQVAGWHAGETGSLLVPPPYQKLGGAWVHGKDPAGENAASGGGN
jgi:predicted dehydrogenase